jgi:hypothetical protein
MMVMNVPLIVATVKQVVNISPLILLIMKNALVMSPLVVTLMLTANKITLV